MSGCHVAARVEASLERSEAKVIVRFLEFTRNDKDANAIVPPNEILLLAA
jgi:hypothetical protein